MTTVTCPQDAAPADDGGDPISGCGVSFDAEPDHDGFYDCPHCGLFFKVAKPCTCPTDGGIGDLCPPCSEARGGRP